MLELNYGFLNIAASHPPVVAVDGLPAAVPPQPRKNGGGGGGGLVPLTMDAVPGARVVGRGEQKKWANPEVAPV